MKTLHFSIMAILLIISVLSIDVAYAQSYPNSPVLPEGSNPPVIISQVELDSPFKFLPDNETCTSTPDPKMNNNCLTNLVPNHKVKCQYFMGSSTCEPLHQSTSDTNVTCIRSQAVGTSSDSQWFDVYNAQDKPIQLEYFDVRIPPGNVGGTSEFGPYYSIPTIGPHEKCTFGLSPFEFIGALVFDPTNRTITVSYDYEGKHYTVSTPKLTDVYNDTRTWQYDGNKWIFAEQNTVPVPEFPFVIPILLVSIMSLIVFYRIRIRE